MGSVITRRGVATIAAIGIAVALFALLLVGTGVDLPFSDEGGFVASPETLPNPADEILEARYDPRLRRDAIRPIYDPEFGPVAESSLDADELIMGLVIDGDARAYPVTTLRRREMVNDVVGGRPVLVTW